MGYSTKKFKQEVKVEDMEFPGVLKEHAEIPGVNLKNGISRADQEKIMWKFHRYWFLTLKFPRGVTQFCRISRGESLFSLEFPRVK